MLSLDVLHPTTEFLGPCLLGDFVNELFGLDIDFLAEFHTLSEGDLPELFRVSLDILSQLAQLLLSIVHFLIPVLRWLGLRVDLVIKIRRMISSIPGNRLMLISTLIIDLVDLVLLEDIEQCLVAAQLH